MKDEKIIEGWKKLKEKDPGFRAILARQKIEAIKRLDIESEQKTEAIKRLELEIDPLWVENLHSGAENQ